MEEELVLPTLGREREGKGGKGGQRGRDRERERGSERKGAGGRERVDDLRQAYE